MPKTKPLPDHCFSEKTCLVLCPKCKNEMKEIWLTHKISGVIRKTFKRMYVICGSCKFDLASIQVPEQKLIIQKA